MKFTSPEEARALLEMMVGAASAPRPMTDVLRKVLRLVGLIILLTASSPMMVVQLSCRARLPRSILPAVRVAGHANDGLVDIPQMNCRFARQNSHLSSLQQSEARIGVDHAASAFKPGLSRPLTAPHCGPSATLFQAAAAPRRVHREASLPITHFSASAR